MVWQNSSLYVHKVHNTCTRHVQAISKEDKIKLEPSAATGCVDGSKMRGMVVWYGMVWYRGVKPGQP